MCNLFNQYTNWVAKIAGEYWGKTQETHEIMQTDNEDNIFLRQTRVLVRALNAARIIIMH